MFPLQIMQFLLIEHNLIMLVNTASEFKVNILCQCKQLTDCGCARWTETVPHVSKPPLTEWTLCCTHCLLYYLFQWGHSSSFLLHAQVFLSLLSIMHSLHPTALFLFTFPCDCQPQSLCRASPDTQTSAVHMHLFNGGKLRWKKYGTFKMCPLWNKLKLGC